MSDTVQIDSLIANEFQLELNGETVSGIFRVTGLTTLAYDESGNRVRPPFEVAKMVQRDKHNGFNTWLRDTLDSVRDGGDPPQNELVVVAVDDGVVTRRWIANGARIVGVSYSQFDSSSFEMIEEVFTIAYDDITEEWPAS